MKESIKQFKNVDELIKELESRKLVFPDEDSKKIFKAYLKNYGYFSFVKKMSNDLMYSDVENKIFKEEFTSNNLRYLFDIDRNNSVVIFKYFRNIEFLLNSSMLKVIAKQLNKIVKCPYIAAIDSNSIDKIFPNIDKKIPNFKKWEKSTFINFYEDLFKNFNNKDFDCYEVIEQNMKEEDESIKELIDNGWFKEFINNLFIKNKRRTRRNWEYLDIFSLFQTLTFSQLLRIFSYLSISLQNEIIMEFFSEYKHENKYLKLKADSFNDLLTMFSDLRNILMHNGCLTKFNYTIESNDIKDNFEKYFNISINSHNSIRLNEMIIVMESIINIKGRMFDEIKESWENKIKNRSLNRTDKISKIVSEIIENESGIKLE
ncbi:MAG: Abi family protein [Mycoplasma sp.]|nr:Abi family protein [Mycoplasma sp.]